MGRMTQSEPHYLGSLFGCCGESEIRWPQRSRQTSQGAAVLRTHSTLLLPPQSPFCIPTMSHLPPILGLISQDAFSDDSRLQRSLSNSVWACFQSYLLRDIPWSPAPTVGTSIALVPGWRDKPMPSHLGLKHRHGIWFSFMQLPTGYTAHSKCSINVLLPGITVLTFTWLTCLTYKEE